MSSPRVQINPAVLCWAREWFNMGPAYLAQKMGIAEDVIKSWERGEKFPTYIQLKKLSNILEKPLEIFLYPNVPKLPSLSISYRSVYGDYADKIPPEILKVISHAKNFQEKLRDLTQGQNPATKNITDLQLPSDISESVDVVRSLLEIDLEQQKKNSGNFSKAFEMWRNAFANVGIYIYKEPFDNREYSGFCLHDTEYPIICVNNSMSYTRQIFTLFHELYHLICKQNGVDITDDSPVLPHLTKEMQDLECNCDRFAAEFLVPSDDFQFELNNIPILNNNHIPILKDLLRSKKYQEVVEAYVDPLSKRYCVSKDVILRKMENQDLRKWYYQTHDWDESRNSNKNKKKSGGNYYSNQVCYLGRQYIHLVMSAQEEYDLPDYIVAEYLETTVSKLPHLLEATIKGDHK